MGQVDGNPIFTIDLDFVDDQLRMHTLDGRAVTVPLEGQSVSSFYVQTLQAELLHRFCQVVGSSGRDHGGHR